MVTTETPESLVLLYIFWKEWRAKSCFLFLNEWNPYRLCRPSMFHLTCQSGRSNAWFKMSLGCRNHMCVQQEVAPYLISKGRAVPACHIFAIPALDSLIHLSFTSFSLSFGHLELLQETRKRKPFFRSLKIVIITEAVSVLRYFSFF